MNVRLHKSVKLLAEELGLKHYDINHILYTILKEKKEKEGVKWKK